MTASNREAFCIQLLRCSLSGTTMNLTPYVQTVTSAAFSCGLRSVPIHQLLEGRNLTGLCLDLVETRAHKVLVQVCGACVEHAHLIRIPCPFSTCVRTPLVRR